MSRPVGPRTWRVLGLWLVLMGLSWLGGAVAQTPEPVPFDHLSTGFALMDAHARASCESCHQGGVLKGTPRTCDGCHVAGRRLSAGNTVMPPTHLPTTQSCDACHNSASFIGARFRHIGVMPGSCVSCHNGVVTDGKTASHVPTTASCDSCHRSTAWLPARGFDHAGVVPGSCQGCHNGSRATGKSAQHMPTGTAIGCDSCHASTRAWVPTKWNHTQTVVTAQCASCHSGGYPPADGKPANHIPYTAAPITAAANCDGCHKGSTTTWTNGRLHASYSLSTSCATCHNGSYGGAVGKPSDALHATVTGNCESCHKSTTDWGAAKVDHAGFNAATNCAGCHNGSAASGKPATHIPTGSATCFSCHGTTTWTPTKWNHTQVPVTAQCASCHSGGYPPADGKPANHIPYAAVPVTAAANCDTCHKGGTTTWTNGRLHANVSLSTSCATCHNGSYGGAIGKPTNALHTTVTGNCEGCHKSTTNWSVVDYAHSPANAVGTGTCDNCHNGSTASGKPPTHIPVPAGAAKCDSCHRSQTGWTASVTMKHGAVVAGSCKSCHGGGYTGAGATAKPANHIPEVQLLAGAAMDCNACHTATTSWGSMRMNHNNSQGNGAGWCKACHDRSTNWLGDMEKKALTHEKSSGVTDCSQSGCHRPLGNEGNAYTKWE